MSPSAEKKQCPFCFGWRRVKSDGTFYAHDRGRPGMKKRCPGSGRTKEGAREAKAEGINTVLANSDPSPKEPGDIF